MQQQQAQIRTIIGQIAQNCFKLCVVGKPGTRLSGGETECMVRQLPPAQRPPASLRPPSSRRAALFFTQPAR